MNSAPDRFIGAIRAAGLNPPEVIEPGKLHRFSTNGKSSDDAGWCKLFEDLRGGVFGDFRSGLSETWQAQREKPFTPAERETFRQRCEAERTSPRPRRSR
jgi:putative DNA primase/helicase